MEFLEKFGFPIAVAAALAWFIAYKLWPQFVKQAEATQKTNAEFVKALDAMGDKFQTHSEMMGDKMDTIIEGLKQGQKPRKGKGRSA